MIVIPRFQIELSFYASANEHGPWVLRVAIFCTARKFGQCTGHTLVLNGFDAS